MPHAKNHNKAAKTPTTESQSYTQSSQGRINHSGAPYQGKAGTLFSYAYPGFSLSGCPFLFFSQKVDYVFLVVAIVVTFKPAYTACSNTAW